jgi:hypothetical protein
MYQLHKESSGCVLDTVLPGADLRRNARSGIGAVFVAGGVVRHEHSHRAWYDLNLNRRIADHLAVTLNWRGLIGVHGYGGE